MDRNRLGEETSPYLLQHKDNPVHWQAWSEATLDAAKAAKVQSLINGHFNMFADELTWIEQIRRNPAGPNPFVLTQDQFAKYIDIMKDCAESRVVAMDYRGLY